FRDFRVVLDGGGDDGLDWYFGSHAADEDWCDGNSDCDVGLWVDCANSCEFDNVQVVGPFKMAGRLITTVPRDPSFSDGSAYDNVFKDCIFEGFTASSIRGYDSFSIIALTSTTVDVVWAD